MKRTLIPWIFGVLILGLLVGIWIGIEIGARSEEQRPWPEDEVLHFKLSVSSNEEAPPVKFFVDGWRVGENIMFLNDVSPYYFDEPYEYNTEDGVRLCWGQLITFVLYDRESVNANWFNPDSWEIKETKTVCWTPLFDPLRLPTIFEMGGGRWQILRVFENIRWEGRPSLNEDWEVEHLVIMRWIH